MADPNSHTFGQRQPPLSVTIKAILERYPDGQIFKEIIQNADDAGARIVHFYLDGRQHGTHSLVNPELARFQGPALLAYNDAKFEDSDWEGIQNLQQSGKVEDPFKVGKFGIGFNSVYHITDLPVIVSGRKLAYLEPQEKVWEGKSGQWFEISELQTQGQDGLAPFDNVCEFSAITTSDYCGTLFRFPLRDTCSKLSENVYTVSKLHKLLAALKEEAKFLLLFLRSVDTIEVFELTEYGRQKLFQVEIVERQQTYQARKNFKDQLKSAHESQSYSINQYVNVVTDFHVTVTDDGCTTQSHWLVANQVGSQSPEVQTAAIKQHVFPWVGVALELNDVTASFPTSDGRTFCFLPIPAESSPPLPVHVNGTFGLNDERRTLKWPGIERKNDPTAKWNTLLVNQLLPPCYALLLDRAKDLLAPKKHYSAWPEVGTVQDTNWSELLRPLFRILITQPVVWTGTTVGRWIVPSEGVFASKEDQISPIVHRVLSSCGVKLVDVPPRIWDAFHHVEYSPSCITPGLTRNCIQINSSSYMNIDAHSKCELLKYCLTDLDQKYSDLQGLCLLPLADGKFVQFTSSGSHSPSHYCYLCSTDCPQDLLPNISHRLVDVQNDSDLQNKLQAVAHSESTQLRNLDTQAVAQLLSDCFPGEWLSCQTVSLPHPSFPSEWFETFWRWVIPRDLHCFTGQLILPVVSSKQSGFEVTKLKGNSSVLLFSEDCSADLLQALTKLQVCYTNTSKFPYLSHSQLHSYVNEPSPPGILTAVANAHRSNITEIQTVKLSSREASTIQLYLSTQLYNPNSAQQNALSSLPVLSALNQGHDQLYSANEAASSTWNQMIVVEPEGFHILNHSCLPSNLVILSRTHNQSAFLNSIPGVKTPEKMEFILSILFPMIKRKEYPDHQMDGLMEQVLQLPTQDSNSILLSELRTLPFLKTTSKIRKSPSELFDPSQQDLKDLYQGKSVFPTHPFDQRKYKYSLLDCGLRGSVNAKEIVEIVQSIATLATVSPQKVKHVKFLRAKAVLKYLGSHSAILNEMVTLGTEYSTMKRVLLKLASRYNWLPVLCYPPEDYPECLSWKGRACTSHLASLNNKAVLFPDHANMDELPTITGSQVYVVDCSPSQELSNIFLIQEAELDHVLMHFQQVIDHFEDIDHDRLNEIVHMTYRYLHRHQGRLSSASLSGIPQWIWIKKDRSFVSPSVVALKQSYLFRQNLDPYLYVLPDDLQQFSSLFSKFGVTNCVTQSQIVSVLEVIKGTDRRRLHAEETWSTVMSILNWLTDDAVELTSDEVLYVPVESDSEYPMMMEASDVVYTDNDFLKDFLASSDPEEQEYTFVHHRIHPHLAHCLGLTPLTEHMHIAEDTFEDVGQYETLTERLKNILREYDGGLTIIKELIQNADDAEATEINICYDARPHNVPPERLLYPGMAECHGPALIVHNDASFTDEDFQNIQKLAAATKEDKPLKIGKFGVGFCSVYHITDVPSFVSHDSMCIFDPTLKYLKKEIKNPARPGKKVKFTERIVTSSQQLVPFAGLYNFHQTRCYDGTMFRFPFRTSSSEISGIIYNENMITKLKEDIQTSGSKLLLFLQHVKRITFSHISPGKPSPEILVDIRREDITPEKVVVLHSIFHNPAIERYEHWLVSSHADTVTFNHTEKYGTAAVACQLEHYLPSENEAVYTPAPITGEVFCFLPLTLHTGLPVHVSANFAVMSNRQGIRSSDEESCTPSCRKEIEWNVNLMKEIIPMAYLNLLTTLQQMCSDQKIPEGKYLFQSLWPLQKQLKTHNPWDHFIAPLYELICSSSLFYSSSLTKWHTLARSKILSPNILCQSTSQSTPDCVLKAVEQFQLPVVELPSSYQEHIPDEELKCSIIDEEQFLNLFFDSFQTLGVGDLVSIRNKVLKCLLQVFAVASEIHLKQKSYIQGYLQDNACIPCSPDGQALKNSTETIDPKALFAELYDPSDRVFPLQEFSDSQMIHVALIKLGMISSSIPWSMLIERARSISDQYSSDKHKALRRVKIILDCTNANLSQQSLLCLPQEASQLSVIKFLPANQKPSEYPLQWFGEDLDLMSPKEMLRYSERNIVLVGSQLPLVCELAPSQGGCGRISPTVQSALEIQTTPNFDQVLEHLCHLIEVFSSRHPTPVSTPPAIECEWVERSCSEIYNFFESQMSAKKMESSNLTELQHKPCVWTGKQFVFPSAVAENWSQSGPYLFGLPYTLRYKPQLIAALSIKKEFTADDFLGALHRIHEAFGSKPVDDRCKGILPAVILALDQVSIEADSLSQTCFLPDNSFVMHDTKTLVFNDAPWCETDAEWTVVHKSIARDAALKLGVKPVRSKLLQKYESKTHHFAGVPFGQRELLTQRIQNILREYPFDVTVLKELLQNADDAKATKMYVILDMRQHGTKSLPSDEWKNLQGPALLVWNDSVFSEEDLKGIQQLGLGNKRADAESIGMYGIGFNVVYHLTDCPSFISNGSILCVLDPHCRYIPGADTLQPGRRYDNLDETFWSNWADLKPAYLREENWPEELKKGSLFRFPLRSTQELVNNSKIVGNSESRISGDLTMEEHLIDWIPQMKEALFFLNHVTELKFFAIKDGHGFGSMPKMQLTKWFEVSVDQTARERRAQLHSMVRDFKGEESRVDAILYPLTIIEKSSDTECVMSQNWIIQQGVGDLMKQDQQWMYSHHIKPKHGIAARTDLTADATKTKLLSGKVFCFLPLPITSRLPLHINGTFILDATRRNLWSSTDPNDLDDRMKWNVKLIEAIASSYSKFLVDAQQFYVKSTTYNSGTQLWDNVQHYYNVFPAWLRKEQEPPQGLFLTLAKMVYMKLAEQNEKVLASIKKIKNVESSTESKMFSVEWHPLLNKDNPSRQGYFWKPSHAEEKALVPILESIGMNLLATPIRLQGHFADLETKVELPIASKQSVHKYYSTFYQHVSETGFPCHIRNSTFHTTGDFKRFTEYLLEPESKPTIMPVIGFSLSSPQVFPDSPFNLPLLLTADEQLRIFDEQNKAIKSEYVAHFPKCQEHFLHPDMLKMNYVASYFLKPSADNWSLICSILSATLPASLQAQVVQKASQHINIQHELKPLWQCLSSDPVFQQHIDEIVSIWALLPSTDDRLFSLRSNDQLLPLDIFSEPMSVIKPVVSVLQQARMPFLDTNITGPYITKPSTAVTGSTKQVCPKLSNHNRVLTNLYCLYQERALGPFLASRDIDTTINTLFEYFASIHFAKDDDSLKKIKSIPLFKNIDGKQCTLLGDVYVWPGSICHAGREKWVKEAKVVFLKKDDVWTKLGSASVLGIQDLTTLQVYTRYIFPHFGLFNEEERLKHLQHIRDGLYEDTERESESNRQQKRSIAIQFLSALKALPCLMCNGTLKPMSDFSDPDVDIFSTFSESFLFPSKELSAKQWLVFFCKIGLRTKVTKKEFIQFCHKVSSGEHKELRKASSVLTNYLFGAEEWYNDFNFLHRISKISFVCTETLSDLNWIKPAYPAGNRIQLDSTAIDMNQLCGAALFRDSRLVWTVKPVVRFPSLPFLITADVEGFYKALGIIVTPNPEDVIQNILNISQTRFSHFSLFDKYTINCQTQKEAHSMYTSTSNHLLIEVVQSNFTFLMKSKNCPDSSLKQLMNRPCIPVCSQGNSISIRKPVLVMPLQVIGAEEVERFRPFINPLPSCLYSVLTNVLSVLGVSTSIQLAHIRVALETAYKHIQQPLDPNTKTVVKSLLRKLLSLLQDSSSVAQNAAILQPLYLPNTEHKLVESKLLLYKDRTHYKHSSFNLSESPYSLFSLLIKHWTEIGFSEKEFCQSLPTEVSPKALSACIHETLNKECSKESEHQSPYAKKLEACFAFRNFTTFVSAMLLQRSVDKEQCAKFRASLEWFLENIEVITMENLHNDIVLEITQPPQNIGTAKVDFLLQKTESSFCLYMDENVSPMLGLQSFNALVNSIVLCVAQRGETDIKNIEEAESAIGLILKAESEVELYMHLEDLQVPIDDTDIYGNSFDPNLQPELGARIPENWLHRLDVDVCNIFRPEEWVGYEAKEGVIVFAIVIHRILQPGQDSDQPDLTDQYLIRTSPDDQEGKTVSILELYKILRSAELSINQEGNRTLCLFNPDSEATQLRQSLTTDDLKSIKRQICEELKHIWKLSEDQKRKAIKRLYLKWHPDKHPNPEMATKAFQYLRRQITRLEAGRPLEEPEQEEDTTPYEPSPRWMGWYNTWDSWAGRADRARHRERDYYSTRGGYSAFRPTFTARPTPEPETGRVWMKQAEADMKTLKIVLAKVDTERESCCHICFLAHEVAERALKAGKYAVCGLHPDSLRHHDLVGHAGALEQERRQLTVGLQQRARALESPGYYLKTRFPNQHVPLAVPAEQFSPTQAKEAATYAEEILDMMKQIVEQS